MNNFRNLDVWDKAVELATIIARKQKIFLKPNYMVLPVK